EDRDDLVGVVAGVPAVIWDLADFAGQGLPVGFLILAGEVTGLVVSGDDQEGLIPGGVLLNPGDDSVDSVVKVLLLLDVAGDVVGVAGPVDGAALDHEVEAIRVLAQDVECA